MLRTVRKPRWIGLLVAVIAVDVLFALLGLWQLNVARDEGRREALENAHRQAPVPIQTLVEPHAVFGELSNRPVTAVGRYLPEHQVVVEGRRLGERSGVWIVTPFQVAATGATLPVLRGFVDSSSPAAQGRGALPTSAGEIALAGTLGPGESPVAAPEGLPTDRLPVIDLSRLVNAWPGPMYNAVLLVSAETPEASPGLSRVPVPEIPSGLTGRNLAYAVQWWVFALFATWMWWKMVRDDHLADQRAASARAAQAQPQPASQPAARS